MHAFDVFNHYEKTEWHLNEIPWSSIDLSQVKPEYLRAARSAVIGECNSVAAMHGFLNESSDNYDFAAYSAIWGYQEIKHHYAFKTWLQHLGEEIESSRVEATREAYPPGITVAATMATNIISELTVCHVYNRLSKHVTEPVLSQIMALASQDEARHAREFTIYCKKQIEKHPHELASVLETLYVYIADPMKLVKHPVSVFKNALPEMNDGKETIDDIFDYFLEVENGDLSRVQASIYNRFSSLTGFQLDSPASIRRALGKCYAEQPRAEA
jgi:hypothetical protein